MPRKLRFNQLTVPPALRHAQSAALGCSPQTRIQVTKVQND